MKPRGAFQDVSTELQTIVESQREWAANRDLTVLDSGHTTDLEANLFVPLDADTERELRSADGRPLGDGSKPGDLQLLESTLALACNVFAPLRNDPQGLAAAFGYPATRLRFCAPAGDDPMSAQVEVLLESADRPTAVRATYTEPYRSSRPQQAPANRVSSAWLEATEPWNGLPGCRQLAHDLRVTPRRYEHLAAADLLTTAAALTTQYGPRGFRLVHVWHELPGVAAEQYQREIERFQLRIGGEIDFRAVAWHRICGRLAGWGGVDSRWVGYLRERYSLL
jgi:hypothetical protein